MKKQNVYIKSGEYTRVPLYKELGINSFDFMSMLRAVSSGGPCIFLESAGKTKNRGRFSYLCFNPSEIVTALHGGVEVRRNGAVCFHEHMDIFTYIDSMLSSYVSPVENGFGDFTGGYAGYARLFSVTGNDYNKKTECNDNNAVYAEFILVDEFVVYDNHTGRYHVSTAVYPGDRNPDEVIQAGEQRLEELEHYLLGLISGEKIHFLQSRPLHVAFRYMLSDEEVIKRAGNIKDKILDGSILLGSVSNEVAASGDFSPFNFYLKLRGLSPAPYMYFMNLLSCSMAGSSPETHLKIKNSLITMKPSSGLIQAPESKKERAAVKRELQRSQIERSVHTLMVDRNRDDVCAIAVDGSVEVKQFMDVEEYLGMMRIVSRICAKLHPDAGMAGSVVRILAACSGHETEGTEDAEETLYGTTGGGIAGYFGFNSSCDTCAISGCAMFTKDKVSISSSALVVVSGNTGEIPVILKSSVQPALNCLGYAL